MVERGVWVLLPATGGSVCLPRAQEIQKWQLSDCNDKQPPLQWWASFLETRFHYPVVMVSFNHHNLESPGKGISVRACLNWVDLWTCLWEIVLTVGTDVGRHTLNVGGTISRPGCSLYDRMNWAQADTHGSITLFFWHTWKEVTSTEEVPPADWSMGRVWGGIFLISNRYSKALWCVMWKRAWTHCGAYMWVWTCIPLGS